MDENLKRTTLETRYSALNQLVEVSLILSSTLALDPLLYYIMEAAVDLANAAAASILLVDQHTQELVFTATSSGGAGAQQLVGKPVPLDGSIAGTVLREKRTVAIDDVSQDARHYRQTDEETQFQTRSVLGVPMRIKDRVIGVLEAVNKLEGTWSGEDEYRLTILAAQAAVAIENARLVTELQDAYEELSQVDKLKNDFIAIASHELRTPLGVILGYASFLKDESEGAAGEHAEAVLRSALQLRTLIEDMVNLRFLKTGKSELDLQTVALSILLADAQQEVTRLATAKGHTLEFNLPDGELLVVADAHLLGMALGNILNNAVRFTPDGGHIVVGTVLKSSEVWITIKDNGVGLPEEHLDKIFDEFYQVEDHMTRQHGGMGLGLSIARGLTEAHGGRLWAESPGLGQGSTLFMCLPLASTSQ